VPHSLISFHLAHSVLFAEPGLCCTQTCNIRQTAASGVVVRHLASIQNDRLGDVSLNFYYTTGTTLGDLGNLNRRAIHPRPEGRGSGLWPFTRYFLLDIFYVVYFVLIFSVLCSSL
jgi:hypothetical protein